MRADQRTEDGVLAVFQRFTEAYANRDLPALLSLCVPDSDFLMIGTGADEKRIGQAEVKLQAERDWAQSDTASFVVEWTTVSCSGAVAWLASDCTAHATVQEHEITMPIRLTAVLEQRGDKWLFAQMHLSAPLGGQDEGESFPIE